MAKDYTEVTLGKHLRTILDSADALLPSIKESLFVQEVLPLLRNPFKLENLKRYVAVLVKCTPNPEVVSDISTPLRVMSDDDPERELFRVPALLQRPSVTLADAGGVTADDYLKVLTKESERGVKVRGRLELFLGQITHMPDVYNLVFVPLGVILKHYGLEFEVGAEGNEAESAVTKPTEPDSSFSDDYED